MPQESCHLPSTTRRYSNYTLHAFQAIHSVVLEKQSLIDLPLRTSAFEHPCWMSSSISCALSVSMRPAVLLDSSQRCVDTPCGGLCCTAGAVGAAILFFGGILLQPFPYRPEPCMRYKTLERGIGLELVLDGSSQPSYGSKGVCYN